MALSDFFPSRHVECDVLLHPGSRIGLSFRTERSLDPFIGSGQALATPFCICLRAWERNAADRHIRNAIRERRIRRSPTKGIAVFPSLILLRKRSHEFQIFAFCDLAFADFVWRETGDSLAQNVRLNAVNRPYDIDRAPGNVHHLRVTLIAGRRNGITLRGGWTIELRVRCG